ncbi:hypothetical protein MANES_03G013500v8 [Manihot esculenta]|uniref:Uncharacterized protein n=1 Tax=Manihot esculenta TaxID=3983 RepID=A0ACB7HVN0_MANES|nr:hypothetical protein MANES_03G013500v8 [Manihot esculenta]
MMQRRSPPKHRHDGTSPLPLGMDWSPPPRKWFYRVQVGVQSPEGITTTRGVLRRFNDFLKLFADLKKSFPKKNLPPAPPKGLLRMKSRALLEERRCSLEEWMTKLLSDIDLSRSVAVASFLELEAAARSSFQDLNQPSSETSPAVDTTPSLQIPPPSSSSVVVGSSSVTSDYGSDTAYETSELGTPRLGRDGHFEIGTEDLILDEDLTNPIEKLVKYGVSNIDEGLFMGQTILEQLEGYPRHKPHDRHVNSIIGKDRYNGNASKASFLAGNGMEIFSEPEPGKGFDHIRRLSSESVGSDGSSLRASEISNSGILNSPGDGSFDLPGGAEVLNVAGILGSAELQLTGDAQIVLPFDQRHKMNRVLTAMQRRLATAKTDMEDLVARLNQEIAVKDYLTTKVKDLEAELETTKQKNKENLQQAILIERERLTQMQWDMEEMKRKSLEMELKLKSKKDENSSAELKVGSPYQEKDAVLQELDATRKELENLSKQYEELEAKSKADIKFLAKEFKCLKRSQAELKEKFGQSLKEKSEVEKLLQVEREMSMHEKNAQNMLLRYCWTLCNKIKECNLYLPSEEDDNFFMESSVADALDLLSTSDDQIGLLLAEAQALFEDGKIAASADDDVGATDPELRKMLANIFTDNANLRKQVNSVIRNVLHTSRNSDEPPTKIDHVER